MAIAPVPDEGAEVLSFRLAAQSTARVVLTGTVTQEAIEKLIALLSLSKDVYPTKAAALTAHVEDSGHLLESNYDDRQEEA